MKKMSFVLAIVALLMFAAGSSFAYEVVTTNELKLGKNGEGSPGAADGITIGLSPKVNAIYYTDGDSVAEAQWYAIGTVHPGGNKIYATASDLNNIVSKKFAKGTTIDSGLFALPANSVSASDWSENGGYEFD